ncbi:5-formyltetrahydrofolate cyclo-ligase [Salibacterium salarium]|uniref:5-formyltetrahydrofolate cyclo-ligase n=1 Tax=Salibacterium salarium TaxID=284579 RepID=UPI00163A46DA|nr:5-formyltetrahydrofolate cyclo-ligase [Salibacterium salarium]
MQEKREIRSHIKEQFEKLEHKKYREKEKRVQEQLFQSSLWQNAQTVGITISMRNEMDTTAIIEKGWEQQKRIAVPKVDPTHHALDFYCLTSFHQTKAAFAGISEPDPAITSTIPAEHFDLMIVPGMAFDKEKYRIGFGGGYFDRLLQGSSAQTCAVLFDFQLYEHIPREDHDIPLHWLITETNIL